MVTIELEGSCRTLDDCQDFIADVARNREGLPYVPGSVQCVRPSMAGLGNSTLSGCAVVRPLAPLTAPVLWWCCAMWPTLRNAKYLVLWHAGPAAGNVEGVLPR